MNTQMAYLIGMILGNGEIQREAMYTTVTIDLPHKNLIDDAGLEVGVYVRASLENIRAIIEPLLEGPLRIVNLPSSTQISFTKSNENYTIREIVRLVGNGIHHSTMTMDEELFEMSDDQKKSLIRGFADVTGYIRKSNIAFGQTGHHRVYLEVPNNWDLVIGICNILKSVDIPVQTIDFGHPNFRDSNLKDYNKGKLNVWKREHQIKIWANEFLPIGFNIEHKQRALEKYSDELLEHLSPASTHKFYWEKPVRRKPKPMHPMENSEFLPSCIRGKHFESWTDLAKELGYGE